MKTVPGDNILAATLRAIGDGVISCDLRGFIVMMNPVGEALTGWTETEAVGRPLRDVFVIVHETTRQVVADPVEEALRTRGVVMLANHSLLMRRDGSEVAIDDSAAPVYNAEGEIRGAVLVFRDVSEHRRAEWNLNLLSKAGRVLVTGSSADVMLESIGAIANEHFADLTIFDLVNTEGTLTRSVGPHSDPAQDESMQALHRFIPSPELSVHPTRTALLTGRSVTLNDIDDVSMHSAASSEEHYAFFRDVLKPRSVLVSPVVAEGEKLGALTFIRTAKSSKFTDPDREVAEELGIRIGAALKRTQLRDELKRERAELKTILENLPVGILVSKATGEITYGNPELERLLGHPVYRTENVEQHGQWIAFHADGRQVRGEEYPLPRAMASGKSVLNEEYLYQRGDGNRSWVSISAAPFKDENGSVTGGVVAIADIDGRRRAQGALAASELSNRVILSSTRDRITVFERDGTLVSMNSEGQARLGIQDFDAYVGTSWLNFWKGEQRQFAEAALERALQRGVGSFEGSYDLPSGEKTWWDVTITQLSGPGENGNRLLAVSREVSSRKQAELSLRRSEARFRLLVDCASVGINIGDFQGALSYINPKLLDLLGYTQEEVERGEVRWDQLTPARYAAADQRAMDQLRAFGVAEPYEKVYRAKNGRNIPVLLGASLIPSHDEGSTDDDIAVFFTDLTNQKKAEAALLQSEKLAAVGKLASTISHEINNPLEAVTNLLFIVRQDESLSQTAKDYLAVADRELARVGQVTAQTLRFHRQSNAAMAVAPESLVDEVLQLYGARLSNRNIHVLRKYAPKVLLTCFEGDIRQVLNNLVGNAIDAMKNGGKLSVRTRVARRWSTGEDGVRITIADTGEGIAPDVLSHIFEAFYTTKGIHGTGLGLWISCRIIHKHRGYIRAYSSQSAAHHGTVFAVWLPLQLASSAGEPWHLDADGTATLV